MEANFKQQVKALELVRELDSMKDNVILIPAPRPRFQGHMIRARECKGPEWLQELREFEGVRVQRWRVRIALLSIGEGSGKFRKGRYTMLMMGVIDVSK